VRAFDGAGNVGPAAAVVASTEAPDAAPSAVSDLAASVTSTSVRLTWGAASDDHGVLGYRIWQDGVLVGTRSGGAFSSYSLQPETAYTWTVRAIDTAGQLGEPATVAATTRAPDLTPPTPVEATLTAENQSWAMLTWTAASDDVGVSGYRVYRDGVLYATTGVGELEVRVEAGATYWVTAIDSSGNESVPSNEVTG
jgi:hypothetical protein